MKIGFTPRQVMRLTGVPYSTLNLWAKNNLIRPSIEEGNGSGNERVYSLTDLFALKIAFALRKEGVSTRSLKNVILFFREHEGAGHTLAEARLIVRGHDVIAVTSDKEMVSVLSNPGQTYLSFVLDMSRTLGELAEVAEQAASFALGLAGSSDRSKGQKKPPSPAGGKPQQRGSIAQTR
jgi:DNA-binding transcriptional MerR regulator